MNKEGTGLDYLVDKYRWWIGSILLVAVIVSGGYLIYRTNASNKPIKDVDIEAMEGLSLEIDKQNARINDLENQIKNLSASKLSNTESTDTGTVAGAATQTTEKTSVPSGKINLNTATSTELDTLPGIGPAYAGRIIEYRNSNGGFKNISEVMNIKGIGEKTFEKMKDLITI